ncbi:molybdenum cofactor biosynthesis protein MoaE [Tabrizicola sp.]|jgi:molybdopterin synthase catalytic subunit|uniref:molybdenum cofactor biosynthesis protein MoaE n=1 Tax=Tabrizicola sp. TaxID=2005166 RepID=UPI000BDB413D|nr:molybdenum cofactor biosynthesis protein MoaE [Tabrizicola sp.]MBY0350637.1 molybdenum cofactor biosynthesis protein MoaE [Tabrizicola sp.]MDK2773554.1 molybdenum cofactor biosynthesis protein MoaE [Tabrizicola sp.]OYX19802.1 MAG: molybdenum cofactor biosynthesis protein MoaE [Rhodobacterales bacterium 32-66-9]
MRVAVQPAAFDLGAEVAAFAAGVRGAGAVVSFTGLVRDEGGTLSAMEIEHYPGMTEKAIAGIVAEAMARWALVDALVIHRHGRLFPGEAIMMVATAAPHRGDAFAAAEYLMDYLKSRAPFWKKELGAEGEVWVPARDADEDALKRW